MYLFYKFGNEIQTLHVTDQLDIYIYIYIYMLETEKMSADRGEKLFLEPERAASLCGTYTAN